MQQQRIEKPRPRRRRETDDATLDRIAGFGARRRNLHAEVEELLREIDSLLLGR